VRGIYKSFVSLLAVAGSFSSFFSYFKMTGFVGSLTQAQEEALADIRVRLENLKDCEVKTYASTVVYDSIALRFLRARRFDTDQAIDMLNRTLRFRMDFQGTGVDLIPVATVKNEMKAGKSFYHKFDRDGRPVCVIRPRFHDAARVDQLESQRFSVLMMEYGRRLVSLPTETVTIVFDMSDVSMKNMDIKNVKFMIQMLQDHYPESVGRILIWNTTWLFWGCWKLIRPLLDPVTAQKVCFVDKTNMAQYIHPDNLLKDFGGNDNYQYNYENFATTITQVLCESDGAQQS